MVSLQTINKILTTKDFTMVTKNALDRTYFHPYEAEFDFILNHYNTYHNVPDEQTFLDKFPEFDIFTCNESDKFLLDGLNEEHLYSSVVPVIQKSAELLKGNSIDAVQFLMSQLSGLNKSIGISTVDIIQQAQDRYDAYEEKLRGEGDKFYITSGFKEMDDVIHGFMRGEEFVVLMARVNQGKSWVLTKILTHAWQTGMNVGFVSPEMSPIQIGYRFDTLYQHFNNTNLSWGKEEEYYKDYIEALPNTNDAHFYVSTPMDFGNEITVPKLKTFVENNNIDVLAIDGLSYIVDTRRGKFDNRQAELAHVSEDLFALSSELHIPIITVVQANRDGVKINGGNLGLENVRDSDAISYLASKVISIKSKSDEEVIEFKILKNRNGRVMDKFLYHWIPATGDFEYIPAEDDGNNEEDREEAVQRNRDKFEKKGVVVF